MSSERFEFENKSGETLSGTLELPGGQPLAFALFAHCFTCNQKTHASTRISRGLRDQGFAVLRFDFTGLGGSEGDFGNTNFSSNLDDLRSAIEALRQRYESPQLLIGHSLGGAAVLYLAGQMPEVKMVASIGAPSDPAHVLHLLGDEKLDEIGDKGSANVSIGGRTFSIAQQFIDDVNEASLTKQLRDSNKPVLVFHAPDDQIVQLDNATKIYKAANHPKSFVSLDGADHLLTRKADSDFVANVLATWASRYLDLNEPTNDIVSPPANGVLVVERDGSFTQDIYARQHHLIGDEPESVPGAADLGMTPYELLLAGLGACTSMTLRMYAQRKGIQLSKIKVHLEHDRVHWQDCENCEEQPAKVDRIIKTIEIEGDVTDEQRKRMLEIADMCPVNRTLTNQKKIVTQQER